MRARCNRPEESLHRSVASYLDACLPLDAVWFHPPNGGARSVAEAGIFKALGVKAGIPDVVIVWQGRPYFIELKPEKGKLTQAQAAMLMRLQKAGAPASVCRSVEAVEGELLAWGFLMRGRLAA